MSPLSRPRLLILAALTLGGAGWSAPVAAADAATDVAAGTEVTVGTHRVVLIAVARTTEFAPGGAAAGPRVVTSVRVTYLVETPQGQAQVLAEADLFAAGTTDPAVRPAGKDKGKNGNRVSTMDYRLYLKQAERGLIPKPAADRLPAAKGAGLVTLNGLTLDDVVVLARKADVRVRLPTGKAGQEDRVVFKNVPLE